jgi:tetratricopeptide (TPR) repeat protein
VAGHWACYRPAAIVSRMDGHRTTGEPEASAIRIDIANLCLWRRNDAAVDERLDLPPKAFNILRYLAENAGRLISHDELLTNLWRNVHVQPEVLKSHILAIRNALGDKSSNPRFIETLRGRGYRFIGHLDGLTSLERPLDADIALGAFVERAEPLRTLLAHFQRAAAGEPQTMFVSGEPGIGKTALVQQFLTQARSRHDLIVAQGQCVEGFAGTEPYYPVLDALGQLCRGAGSVGVIRTLLDVAPSWAAQMPASISFGQRMALRQQIVSDPRTRMVREGCGLFEALAKEHPLVLVLEDLHWADFATIDFLSALCRRRSAARLLLIGTYRPEDLTTARHPLRRMTHDLALHQYCGEIELAPLSADAVGEVLTGGIESEQAAAAFTHLIKERTGGNPLFMRVTLDYLQEIGEVSRSARGWRPLVPLSQLASEAPPTLARAIQATIEGMSEDQRRALEAASVCGVHFDPVTVARPAQMDEISFETICETHASGMLRRDRLLTLPNNQIVRTYSFTHVLYQQVLYEQIGQMRRASLHLTIGERLEEIFPPDQRADLAMRLAQHFASAGVWDRALDYLRSALRNATSRFSSADALAILEHAFQLAAHLPDSARIPAEIEFLEWRGAIQALGHDPLGHDTYARMAELARLQGDIDAQCRALVGLAYIASWRDLSISHQVLDDVLKLCDDHPNPIQRDIIRMTAYTRRLWNSGWNKKDAFKCEESFNRLEHCDDRPTIARAHMNFGMLCLISARYRQARDLVDSSYRLFYETSQSVFEAEIVRAAWMRHIGAPWGRFSLGEFGAALDDFSASMVAFESGGDAVAVHFIRVFQGALHYHMMDFEGVLRACGPAAFHPAESYQSPPAGNTPLQHRIALIYCGLAEAGLGNNNLALDHLRVAEAEMDRRPVHLDWYWRLPLEWGVVNVLIATGDYLAALARAERLCELAGQSDERTWQGLAWEANARAAQSCGQVTKAMGAVESALAACDGVEVPLAEWRVHATAASVFTALGDDQRAGSHLRLGDVARRRLIESLREGDPARQQFERRSAELLGI